MLSPERPRWSARSVCCCWPAVAAVDRVIAAGGLGPLVRGPGRHGPEQVRYHYIARELVVTWLRGRNTRTLPQVEGLAHRLQLV